MSESQGPGSDMDAFMDDEMVAVQAALRKRRGGRIEVPRVTDQIGYSLSLRFEHFLETFVVPSFVLRYIQI